MIDIYLFSFYTFLRLILKTLFSFKKEKDPLFTPIFEFPKEAFSECKLYKNDLDQSGLIPVGCLLFNPRDRGVVEELKTGFF